MKKNGLRKMYSALLAAALLAFGCGCGAEQGTQESAAGTESSVKETVVQEAAGDQVELFADCTYITEEMYASATDFIEGDLTRIAAAMRKAKAGERVVIGTIGGSITQGSSASSQEECYASLLKKWWEKRFPEAEIELVNAGIGATTSYLGVHRVERDLLSYNPDFVVIEFSVNDSNDNFYKKTYDNLIYRVLHHETEPALLLLFMTMDNGTSAQGNDSMLGFQYGLPMVSYGNAVLDEMKAGRLTWKEISPDNIHPNTKGHKIVGELVGTYLDSIYNRLGEIPEEKKAAPEKVLTKPTYLEGQIIDAENAIVTSLGSYEVKAVNNRFPDGWYSDTCEEPLVLEVEGSNIGIMFQKMVGGKGGAVDVYVDGVCVRTLNADFTGGWGDYCETIEVFTSTEKSTHVIEFKKKDPEAAGGFAVLGLLVS